MAFLNIYIIPVMTILLMKGTLVTCANRDYLKDTIRGYFSDTRHHVINSAYKTKARKFIFSEFQRFGLDAEYQNFQPLGSRHNFSNVIGVRKGANFGKKTDRIIGVLAHYDTVPTSKGVDDNGAGVAAILEVARQMHEIKVNTEHTVIFVSTDLEESGLVGSSYFVSNWLPEWTLANYEDSTALLNISQGCIVLDTVMEYNTSDHSQTLAQGVTSVKIFPKTLTSIASDNYRGDFLAVIYRQSPDSVLANNFIQSWKAEGRARFEIESFALPFNEISGSNIRNEFGNFLRSDHTNFWMANIPAIFITDTANFRGDMIHCYHAPCDNVKVMLTDDNIQFLGKTADTLVKTTINMAGAPDTSGQSSTTPIQILIIVLTMLIQLHKTIIVGF